MPTLPWIVGLAHNANSIASVGPKAVPGVGAPSSKRVTGEPRLPS